MLAKFMRHAAAGVALLASCTIAHAQPPASAAVYRQAVGVYVKTGAAAIAVKPLLGRDRKALDLAVADTIATGDADLIEAAAALHLEIGVALVGMYLLTYVPKGVCRDGWHEVKVALKGARGEVTARPGYFDGAQ